MFKRLFVLLLLVAATVSVSTPAHASTLTVNGVYCSFPEPVYTGSMEMNCYTWATGGTGSYVSYSWRAVSTLGNYNAVTTTEYLPGSCSSGERIRMYVTVQDSAGASAQGLSLIYTCGFNP